MPDGWIRRRRRPDLLVAVDNQARVLPPFSEGASSRNRIVRFSGCGRGLVALCRPVRRQAPCPTGGRRGASNGLCSDLRIDQQQRSVRHMLGCDVPSLDARRLRAAQTRWFSAICARDQPQLVPGRLRTWSWPVSAASWQSDRRQESLATGETDLTCGPDVDQSVGAQLVKTRSYCTTVRHQFVDEDARAHEAAKTEDRRRASIPLTVLARVQGHSGKSSAKPGLFELEPQKLSSCQ